MEQNVVSWERFLWDPTCVTGVWRPPGTLRPKPRDVQRQKAGGSGLGRGPRGAEGRSVSQTHPERRLKAQISAAKRRYDYPKGASAQGCGWTWSRKNLDDFYAETITPAEMSSVTWTPTETGQDKWYLPSTEQWRNQSRETALSPRPLPSPPPT